MMLRGRRLVNWVLVLVAVWGLYRWASRNRLTVTNESGQAVCGLTVGVGGETLRFGDLAAGASASAHFRIDHEEVFEVRCRLADGTEVHEYEGYVVWEEDLLGVDAWLTVRPGGRLDFSH